MKPSLYETNSKTAKVKIKLVSPQQNQETAAKNTVRSINNEKVEENHWKTKQKIQEYDTKYI